VKQSLHGTELIVELRRALRADGPLALMAQVSGIMAALDPRGRGPLQQDPQAGPTLADVAETFAAVDIAETTAAMTVIAELTADEVLSARLRDGLLERRQPMPAWLAALPATDVRRVVRIFHVLGDGDDYVVEARLPTGDVLTAVVYVDANLGGVVKDAFVIDEGVDAVLRVSEEHGRWDDPDMHFEDTDPADARAVIEAAIELGARLWPPLDTDSWPASRPLVEWLVRGLPSGGVVPDRSWSPEAVAALHEQFLSSSYAEGVDGADERLLLETFSQFSEHVGGDPTRWSEVNVELLLADWVTRNVLADATYLGKAPDLLRAFIRFCHARQGLRQPVTAQVLAAVDRWEPGYLEAIKERDDEVARVLDADQEERPLKELLLDHLGAAVGGRDALMALRVEPLPDEELSWGEIPADVHDRVAEVLSRTDSCADELFDVEHRTAFRRLLGRAAAGNPAIVRAGDPPALLAATVCWSVCRANASVGTPGTLSASELLDRFGVSGPPSERLGEILQALKAPREAFYGLQLASADFLTAAGRARLVRLRDQYLAMDDA
jgi:hypothetical protein